MTGNTWQFVADWYRADSYRQQASEGVATDPAGPATSLDPAEPTTPKRVIRKPPIRAYAPPVVHLT